MALDTDKNRFTNKAHLGEYLSLLINSVVFSSSLVIAGLQYKMLKLILLCACILGSYALKVDVLGQCPTRDRDDVDISKFTGTWYLTSSFSSAGVSPEDLLTRCGQTVATYNETTNVLRMVDSAIIKLVNKPIEFGSNCYYNATDKYFIVETDDKSFTAPLYLHGSDYTTYAVVSSCIEKKVGMFTFHTEFAYIITRERFPDTADIPSETANAISKALIKAQFTADSFGVIDQSNC